MDLQLVRIHVNPQKKVILPVKRKSRAANYILRLNQPAVNLIVIAWTSQLFIQVLWFGSSVAKMKFFTTSFVGGWHSEVRYSNFFDDFLDRTISGEKHAKLLNLDLTTICNTNANEMVDLFWRRSWCWRCTVLLIYFEDDPDVGGVLFIAFDRAIS